MCQTCFPSIFRCFETLPTFHRLNFSVFVVYVLAFNFFAFNIFKELTAKKLRVPNIGIRWTDFGGVHLSQTLAQSLNQ